MAVKRQSENLRGLEGDGHRGGDERSVPADIDHAGLIGDLECPPEQSHDFKPDASPAITEWFHVVDRIELGVRTHRRGATPPHAPRPPV